MRSRGVRTEDSGSATVFVAIGVATLLVFSVIGVQLGAAMIARHRAESAADLGALAGAAQILSGHNAACARAQQIVVAAGARLDSCAQVGLDLLVTVSVSAGILGGLAVAKARAGPA